MYVCNVSFGEDFENLELQKSDFPNSLSILYGCVSIVQVCIQIAFISNLKQKVSDRVT
jgi:hypothetical protein